MRQCSIAEPPLPKRSTSGRSVHLFSSFSDFYLLVIVLLSITFIVVLLAFFTFSLKLPANVEPLNIISPVSSLLEKKNASSKAKDAEKPQQLTTHKFLRKPSSGSNEFRSEPNSAEQALLNFSVVVYTDHPACSDIGRAVLLQGGNSMDAAIASFLCLSAAFPHRGGLGGGLMATIYKNSQCFTLNAREICPVGATEAYYMNRRDEAVVEQLAVDLQEFKSLVLNNPRMRSQFVNETTGKLLFSSEKMFCPLLADFLQDLMEAENPLDYFYRGQVSRKLVKSIEDKNGFITMEDLEDCESEIQPALKMFVGGHTICGPPPPSTYSVVQLAVTAMIESNSTTMEIPFLAWDKSKFIGDPIFDEAVLKDARELIGKDVVQHVLHRLRNRYGPDIQYEPTEQGSFSILTVDENGDAVVMSSSLGDKFGNRELTEFGFFMNNAMGSFAYGTQQGTPQSRSAPLPAKCPRTQMSPVIGIKNEQVAFLTGGANYLEVTASLYQALTSRQISSTEKAPLVCRSVGGLILHNRNESLLVGY